MRIISGEQDTSANDNFSKPRQGDKVREARASSFGGDPLITLTSHTYGLIDARFSPDGQAAPSISDVGKAIHSDISDPN